MKLISHRGLDNHNLLENSIDAIEEVLMKDYICGVEFDIRFTKDKKIVIYHDMTIKIDGVIHLIKNKTLNELKRSNIKIDTLENLLKKINNNKILLIEIKEEGEYFDDFIISLFKILKKYKLNYYICSFNYKLIKKIKSKYPKYKVGLIIGYFMNTKNINNDLDFYLYGNNFLELIDKEKETFIFTINSKEKLESIKKYINDNTYIISNKSYLFN